MEDFGVVDEKKPARRSLAVNQNVKTGWEAVVFLIEEIGSEESPHVCSEVCSESVPPREAG